MATTTNSSQDNHSQEVRFALVLYGGVSLAIYINGVMQEMLQLVRSTSGQDLPDIGSAKVYRKLGAMLERGRIPSLDLSRFDLLPEDAPIKTKFKVDIISGTSAGGINGIFLAKALANNADNLDEIQELWFSEGAIESLLNDHRSYSDIAIAQPEKTNSLLNSKRMYVKLLNAFDGMDKNRPVTASDTEQADLAEEIDLFATTTDIEGVPVPIQLFDNVVYERRYRNAFHLSYSKDDARNDFESDNNPFLAFAARCTSSFPFAFEPMQLCNVDEILKSSPLYAKKKYCFSGSTRWQKFYTNYLQGVLDTSKEFPQRPFGDGGYLNNAPFSYAVDALLQRQAAVPIDRKLLYVEPSPAHPEEEPVAKDVPNAIQNSLDALVVIPGYQTIRNDLMLVLERNRQATKINKTLAELEIEIQRDPDRCGPLDGGVEEIWFQEDDCYRAYYRMRSAEVTDQIATMLAHIYAIDEDSAYFSALRSLVRAWREEIYRLDPRNRTEREKGEGLENFLRSFDLPYRVRRLRFVLRKLDSLYGLTLPEKHPARNDALSALRFGLASQNATELPAGLRKVREEIFQRHHELAKLLQRLLEPPIPDDTDTPRDKIPSPIHDPVLRVRETLPKRPAVMAVLARILGDEELGLNGTAETEEQDGVSTPQTRKNKSVRRQFLTTRPNARKTDEPADLERLCDGRAWNLVINDPNLGQHLRKLGAALKDLLDVRLNQVQEKLTTTFEGNEQAGRIAKRFFHCFDLFDAIQYPMTFNTNIGEAEVVQIIRVCPEDAVALGPEDAKLRRAKLKGLVAAHFGAFLDLDWRVNDLLWGRLDAAERIITALLPWDDVAIRKIRDTLIDEAQSEILADFKAPQRLLQMATRQAVQNGSQSRISDSNATGVIVAAAKVGLPAVTLDAPARDIHRNFMNVWGDIVPVEPDRTLMMRTLARSTQIIGRTLETISENKALAKQASWITSIGRALWGLVEISVPRSLLELLGKYWQSLLLLIAIILLVGGLISGQKGVSGAGWSLMGIAVALFTIRAIFGSWMRGRNIWGFIRGVLILLILSLIALGGYRGYELSTCNLPRWLKHHGVTIIEPNCKPNTSQSSEPAVSSGSHTNPQ